MKQDYYENAIKRAVDTYGFDSQRGILTEECGELITAASHYGRGREGAFDNFVEELADVSIMVDQMVYALDAGAAFAEAVERKVRRLTERMEKEKEGRRD